MTDDTSYPTTPAHFAAFKDEAAKWIARFGLQGWQIEFGHLDINSRAECRFNVDARAAGLILGKDFLGSVSEHLVRRSAFHEVCELLLSRCWDVAHRQDLTPSQRRDSMTEAQHEVIRILENTVWGSEQDGNSNAEDK